MEKRKLGWMLAVSLVISLVIMGGSLTQSVKQQRSAASPLETQLTSTATGYLLKITDDTIGIYRVGSSSPYQKLEISLNLLSEKDYKALETGIYAETAQELRQRIEDLTS